MAKYAPRSFSVGQPTIAATTAATAAAIGRVRKKFQWRSGCMRRPVSTLDRDLALEGAVAGGVVGLSVVPHAPEDAGPGASDGADGALVAAGAGVAVEAPRPGVVVSGRVGESGEGVAEAFVAGVAEGGVCLFAGLDRDGGHAAVGGERFAGGVAVAAVADLGEQSGGGDDRLGVAEERAEDFAVAVGADGVGDVGGQLRDPFDERPERRHEREHDLPARLELGVAGAARGGGAQPFEQLPWGAPAGVAVAGEKGGEALLAEPRSVDRAGVALEEGERDLGVDVSEDLLAAWPEALQLGAQLVGER